MAEVEAGGPLNDVPCVVPPVWGTVEPMLDEPAVEGEPTVDPEPEPLVTLEPVSVPELDIEPVTGPTATLEAELGSV